MSKASDASSWTTVDRTWGSQPAHPNTTNQTGGQSPLARFMSERQRDQPWNAIGAVNVAGQTYQHTSRAKEKADSDRATKGSTSYVSPNL